jgi:hypothetical protein
MVRGNALIHQVLSGSHRSFMAKLHIVLFGTEVVGVTVDLYFSCGYKLKYYEVVENLMRWGIVRRQNGNLVTVVKP